MTHTLPANYLLQNRYRITKLIGQGGFGITYAATDEKLDSKICLKELFVAGNNTRGQNQTVLSQTANSFSFGDFVQRFVVEARQLAKFKHPNIVRVLDIFQENQTAYMVMEFVEGDTLKNRVQDNGPFDLDKAFPIMYQLLDAIEAVHEAGMLHRDIKPDNVLLSKNNQVVLIDFGSAREFTDGKTTTQTAILTPGYAPPEQYSDRAKRGPFTDIYALGATMYFLLTGQKPLVVTDRFHGHMQAPHEINPKISSQVSSAIMLALQLKPEDRFQSAAEFREVLQQLAKPNQKPIETVKEIVAPKEIKVEAVKEKAKEIHAVAASPKKSFSPKQIAFSAIGLFIFLLVLLFVWQSELFGASNTSDSNYNTKKLKEYGEKSTIASKDSKYYQRIAGKRLYYSIYPKSVSNTIPYYSYCFLADGRFFGSSNKMGLAACPTDEIFEGTWTIDEESIVIDFKASNSYAKQRKYILINKLDNLDSYAIELGKNWWFTSNINPQEYHISISFEPMKNWVFDDVRLIQPNWTRRWDTSSRLFSLDELRKYSKKELRLMRNEIFAAYGHAFKSGDLAEYFINSSCLKLESAISLVSPLEHENIQRIQQVEKELGN